MRFSVCKVHGCSGRGHHTGEGVDNDSFKTFRAASPPEAQGKGGLRHPIIKLLNHVLVTLGGNTPNRIRIAAIIAVHVAIITVEDPRIVANARIRRTRPKTEIHIR